MPDTFPDVISSEEQLDELLTRPSPVLIEMMTRLDGDLMILGIAGKMGPTLGNMAVRAILAASVSKKVFGVARFSDPAARNYLEEHGIETIQCDLLDPEAVSLLPEAKNVIYMAGRKFETQGNEYLTWAMNVMAPQNAVYHFRRSRTVAFSTGCVYPLVTVSEGGSREEDPPHPVGEYAQSCLGRERVFEYASRTYQTPVCLYRLNYAIDLRYGVLFDIGRQVYLGRPIDLSVSHFNAIWQGDANQRALLCLDHCSAPASVLNITGAETTSVRDTAEEFGRLFEKPIKFTGGETKGRMYLSNASKSIQAFGPHSVSIAQMIRWQAAWITANGRSLNKPTHYEVINGNF
jgi:hypothetical protein